MKPGDLVQRRVKLLSSYHEITAAHEEAMTFNRKINIIWAFATNRSADPPYKSIEVPPAVPCLLLDDKCNDFYEWVKNSRYEDPRNVLSAPIVKLLHDGKTIITLAKWIEPIQKSPSFRCGEL